MKLYSFLHLWNYLYIFWFDVSFAIYMMWFIYTGETPNIILVYFLTVCEYYIFKNFIYVLYPLVQKYSNWLRFESKIFNLFPHIKGNRILKELFSFRFNSENLTKLFYPHSFVMRNVFKFTWQVTVFQASWICEF